ncbi:hypothetical protein [Pseudoramibacter porci]|uniref:Uncharacterized protein n=1 Tax=Pseudoramibacter porci TaxID=2606631 RepID=A0A7X2T9R9_9FIRM|nr:hypothetical protein [Pseudoramibacter porci]MSS19672.1 hypothetical protein [Pseudoramibacter porci]
MLEKFETRIKSGKSAVISNNQFEVEVRPRVYDHGYTITKRALNNPLNIIEIRDIRLPLSITQLLKSAKEMLDAQYNLSAHGTL